MPSYSRITWWESRSGNFTTLSSKDGQYLADRPLICPPYRAEYFRLLRMMVWGTRVGLTHEAWQHGRCHLGGGKGKGFDLLV